MNSCKRFKSSMYNNYIYHMNNIILYNSYSKNIVSTNRVSEIESVRSNMFQDIEESFLKKLFEKGFIVEANDDEVLKANLSNYDNMFDRNLDLVIMPTEECNFRCKYCYENYENGEMSENTQKIFIKWFQKNVGKYEGVNLSWFGGEPLYAFNTLDKLSNEMLEICHKKGIKYSSSITTNGFLLSLETFKKLLKNRITYFQITLDGLEESHDKLRCLKGGQGSFSHIMENLRNIRDSINSKTFTINIRTNVTLEFLSQIHNYIKFMHDEFGNDSRFRFYFRPVGDWGGDSVKEVKGSIITQIDKIYNILENYEYKLNYAPYINLLKEGMCSAGKRNSYVIRSNGKVCKCTMLLDEEKNCIGELLSTGNMKIDYEKISNWVRPKDQSERCMSCTKRPSCYARTCPAKGFILDEKGKCGYENSYLESLLKLLHSSNLLEEC